MKTRKFMVLFWCAAACFSGLVKAQDAAPSAPADPMALLKVLPADATAFVAVPNLNQLDKDVKGVMQTLQLADMVPGVLDLIRSNTGIGRGLNENGSLAFVILSLKEAKTPDDIGDRLVVYIPTANPDQLLQSLGGEKDGDLMKIRLMNTPTVAAPTKGFVVAAEKADAVRAALKATRLGIDQVMSPDRVKAYMSNNLFAWADPRSLSKELRTQLREGITELMGQMKPATGAAAQPKPEGMPQLEAFFEDVQEFTVGVSADSKRGLVVNWYARPREDSAMAKQAQAVKGMEGSLLAGLPKEPIIFAMGTAGVADESAKETAIKATMKQAFEAWSSAIANAGVQIDAKQLESIRDSVTNLIGQFQRISMSVAGLPPEGGEGRLGIVVVAKVADGQKFQNEFRKLFATAKQLAVDTAKKEGQPEEKINAVADAIQWKPKAEEAGGAVVDHLVVDLDKLPQPSDSEKAELEKVKSFIGKEGILVRVAATGENLAVVTFGGGKKRFEQALELARKGDTGLAQSAAISKVADRLPKGPRMMEGYLAIDNLLDLVMSASAQMGTPIPMPLALRNAAPIAMTVTKVTDSASETQVLVPVELMVSVKELVGPLMMMMGGGGGGPGGAPPEPPSGGELN